MRSNRAIKFDLMTNNFIKANATDSAQVCDQHDESRHSAATKMDGRTMEGWCSTSSLRITLERTATLATRRRCLETMLVDEILPRARAPPSCPSSPSGDLDHPKLDSTRLDTSDF